VTNTAIARGAVDEDALRLHRLMTAYLSSKALFSAVELGIFDVLEEGPRSVTELGQRIGLAERPARMLLLALEGEALVRRFGDRYANEPIASTYLVTSSPSYMGALAAHQGRHFERLVHLTDVLRADAPPEAPGGGYTGAYDATQAWARRWTAAFRASSLLMADALAAAVPLDGRPRLVDLGCASCSYSIAFAKANPGLHVTAVDQPAIADAARELVSQAGLEDRITLRGGNIFEEAFSEHEIALLSHVVQGFDRERASSLIRWIHQWLPPGGELLIHTHLPERATVPFPYVFGLILMANNTQGGETHDEQTTTTWLREAGFRSITVTAVTPISAVVRGVK
jgi:predicted nicotinamide N-methyase